MTVKEIEYAVAKNMNFRQNNIVPNVSWGVGLHECDLLVILRSGWAIEVEIKVSKSDIKADTKKEHGHNDERIRELYFAIPASLYEECKDLIPERAGIITVNDSLTVRYQRIATQNPAARKLADKEVADILRLGNMRTWSLRQKMLESAGTIQAAKRPTARDRYDGLMMRRLNEVYFFLKRDRHEDPAAAAEMLASIELTLEQIDAKKFSKTE